MFERIPQSVARRVLLKAYLSSDHVSDATSKTIAVTISKNGAAFGNPSAGATNATEIANGFYYVDLSTTDIGTAGPLVVRGTASATDNVELAFFVADAHNAGFDGVPSVTAGASSGLPLSVDSSGRVDVLKVNGTSQTARDLGASVLLSSGTGTGQVSLSSGTVTVGTNNDKTGYTASTVSDKSGYSLTQSFPTNFSSLAIDSSGRVNAFLIGILTTVFTEGATGRIAAAFKQFFNIASPSATMDHGVLLDTVTTYTGNTPQTGDTYARLGAPAGASHAADVAAVKVDTAAIKVKTDSLTFTVSGMVDGNVVDWKGATAPAMTGDAFARLGAAGAGLTALGDTRIANLDQTISSLFTTVLTESYNADGSAPTAAQALYLILQRLTEFSVSGTAITIKKLDGSTQAAVLTIDDASSPTSSTRTA